MIAIRAEKAGDAKAIFQVITTAFGRDAEADLVDALRRRRQLTVSLVAERGGQVVGHVAFSPVIVTSPAETWEAVGLGPVAVEPSAQRQGIGTALVREGLRQCRRRNENVVFVLGHPGFYGPFGFVPSKPHGITWERSVPESLFQVAELRKNALAGRGGVVRYQPEFDTV